MTVRERLLVLHLAEKLEKNPQYADKIGVRLLERGCGLCEEKGREKKNV